MFSLYLSSKNSALHRWEQRQLQIERHWHPGGSIIEGFIPPNLRVRKYIWREAKLSAGWVCSAIGKGKMVLGRNRELSIRRGGPRSKEAAARACIALCVVIPLGQAIFGTVRLTNGPGFVNLNSCGVTLTINFRYSLNLNSSAVIFISVWFLTTYRLISCVS